MYIMESLMRQKDVSIFYTIHIYCFVFSFLLVGQIHIDILNSDLDVRVVLRIPTHVGQMEYI